MRVWIRTGRIGWRNPQHFHSSQLMLDDDIYCWLGEDAMHVLCCEGRKRRTPVFGVQLLVPLEQVDPVPPWIEYRYFQRQFVHTRIPPPCFVCAVPGRVEEIMI